MRRLRAWSWRLAGLFGTRRRDRELADELESHLQMHVEDNLRSGMTADEARRAALILLGGIEPTKESYRDRRGMPGLDVLGRDLRFGVRLLRRSPRLHHHRLVDAQWLWGRPATKRRPS